MNSLRIHVLTIPLLAGITCGCGTAEHPTVAVQGQVSLDGNLIETGSILFEPKDGTGAPVSAHISGGKYSAVVQPGAKIIRIRWPKVVGQEVVYPGSHDSPLTDTIEEQIPAQFNTQSRLERDVVADDNIDFVLVPKPSSAKRS